MLYINELKYCQELEGVASPITVEQQVQVQGRQHQQESPTQSIHQVKSHLEQYLQISRKTKLILAVKHIQPKPK